MAINLAGYYRQAGAYNGAGYAGGSGASGPYSDLLLFPWCYPFSTTIPPLQLSYDYFQNGKKCYVGVGQNKTVDMLGIRYYYGPFYFGIGCYSLMGPDDWRASVYEFTDAYGNIIQGPPDGAACACAALYYCVVGTPAANAQYYETLPADGFCCNYNQGYSRYDLYSLKNMVGQFVRDNTRRVSHGAQWKFNGRIISTGPAGSGSGQTVGEDININNDLRLYDGYKSWAAGWLYVGNSAYYDIKQQISGGYAPGMALEPFGEYNVNGSTFSPSLIMYPPGSAGGVVVPSIDTHTITSNNAGGSIVNFRDNSLFDKSVIYACTNFSWDDLFQKDGYFPGYSYPNFGGPFIPTYSIGLMFTSEEVNLHV